MNRMSNIIAFVAVLVSEWFYISTLARTFPPLNCSTSPLSVCDSFIYLRNITEPIDVVASRFNISADKITPFRPAIRPDYLAKIQCSCQDFLHLKAFFYRVNFTVQASDVGLKARAISNKYFSYTAWTEMQVNKSYRIGDQVQLALGCGCPIPGWNSIISYSVYDNDTLSKLTRRFESDMPTIIRLNNIKNPDFIRSYRVYFVPYQKDKNASGDSPPAPQPTLPTSPQEIEHGSKNRHIQLKISISIAAAFLLLLLLSIPLLYCGYCKRAPSPTSTRENGQTENWVASTSEIITAKGTEQEQEDKMDNSLSVPAITNLTTDEIFQMKGYCNQRYQIGEGSFGRVYRGNLKGKDVAIKKIKGKLSKDGKKIAENEIRLLEGKQHKNLVALIAWFVEERAFYLVYEYVNGCTLDEYLRESCVGASLSWKRCMKIIAGTAEGLEFLHRNKIIHVDIKPQNLMLDSRDNEVKIIDFGFLRHMDWEGTHRSTDRVTGTRGYWAPEYFFEHKLSFKHDVYSFGIVALEVITGQRHVDDARGSSHFHIPDYVRYMVANNRFAEALDDRFKEEGLDEFDAMNALGVAELALKCADTDKDQRPDMEYVVTVLNSMTKENNQQEETSEIFYSLVSIY